MKKNELKVITLLNISKLPKCEFTIGFGRTYWSSEIGKFWKKLEDYQYFLWRLSELVCWIHPQDTTNIYNTGETMIFESFINASCNDGKDWIILENERNNCIHHIAF